VVLSNSSGDDFGKATTCQFRKEVRAEFGTYSVYNALECFEWIFQRHLFLPCQIDYLLLMVSERGGILCQSMELFEQKFRIRHCFSDARPGLSSPRVKSNRVAINGRVIESDHLSRFEGHRRR